MKEWKLWIVFDEMGRPWTSTLHASRNGAIGLWMEQCCGTGKAKKWAFWKGAGYACETITLTRS